MAFPLFHNQIIKPVQAWRHAFMLSTKRAPRAHMIFKRHLMHQRIKYFSSNNTPPVAETESQVPINDIDDDMKRKRLLFRWYDSLLNFIIFVKF